eukprot:scaffold79707_cov46-Prasinocladus_malaysianus.AAC.1
MAPVPAADGPPRISVFAVVVLLVLPLPGMTNASMWYDSSLDFAPDSSDNIALNKPTTMSSYEVDDDGAVGYDHSSRAVDGSTTFFGDSCIETDTQSNAWVTVDLEADMDI